MDTVTPDQRSLVHIGTEPSLAEACFRRYRRSLLHIAFRILRNREDAEDALQDGLFSAYRKLDRFEGRSRLFTWLVRIVINAALMKRRTQRRVITFHDMGPWPAPGIDVSADHSGNPERSYTALEIRQMIMNLPVTLRNAVVLCDIDGYSKSEAAERLGLTEAGVRSRLWRAHRTLAELLGNRRHAF